MKAILYIYKKNKNFRVWRWALENSVKGIRIEGEISKAKPLIDDCVIDAENAAKELNVQIVGRMPPVGPANISENEASERWGIFLKLEEKLRD